MAESCSDDMFTVTLPTLKPEHTVFAHFRKNEDLAKAPQLIRIDVTENDRQMPPSGYEDRETIVIISTGSGHGTAQQFYNEALLPILLAMGTRKDQIHTLTTQSESSILTYTKDFIFPKANAGTPLKIVLLSGDGGIIDLVNGLAGNNRYKSYVNPQVVLLPFGTANALYHSKQGGDRNVWGIAGLGYTKAEPLATFTAQFSDGARLLVDEGRQEEPIPITANGARFLFGLVVCSWGLHASLVADSDTSEYRKHGIARFQMAATENLFPANGSPPHAYKGDVSLLFDTSSEDWKPIQQPEHGYVVATMVSNLEGSFCISPASKFHPSSMYVVYFGATTGKDAMSIMDLVYQGSQHVHHPLVSYKMIEGLQIKFDEEDSRWRRVCVDGKIVKVEKGGWVRVLRKDDSRSVVDLALE